MTRPRVTAGPGSYLPVREQHALAGVGLRVAVEGHAEIGPAHAIAPRDELAERLGAARLAADGDAPDAGAGGGRLGGGDRGFEGAAIARRQLQDPPLLRGHAFGE